MSEGNDISISDDVGGVNMEPATPASPMTPDQEFKLKALAAEQGVPVDLDLTAQQAANKIREMEKKASRGGDRGT